MFVQKSSFSFEQTVKRWKHMYTHAHKISQYTKLTKTVSNFKDYFKLSKCVSFSYFSDVIRIHFFIHSSILPFVRLLVYFFTIEDLFATNLCFGVKLVHHPKLITHLFLRDYVLLKIIASSIAYFFFWF